MKQQYRLGLLVALVGTLAYLMMKCYAFIASAAPPFGYYYDLGINAIATEYIAHSIHSWQDVSDNIGWGSWADFPNFIFNPSTTYFILVPIEMLLKNVWLSIKLVQVLETIVACAGATYLYATAVRRDIWCFVAGVLYAILPATALQIRGNLDIGWVYALLPLATGMVLALVRRFGVFALPLCGVVSSLAGFCFAAEFGIASSIPIYIIGVVAAVPRLTLRGIAFAFGGLLCLIGVGSFFILPTIAGGHLFTDPASRVGALAAGSELAIYSESWPALAALMPQEFLLSNFSQFNALPDLGAVWIATSAIWVLTIFAAARAFSRSNGPFRKRILVVLATLLILAMGASLPFGALLWGVLRTIPGLAYIRTPDRFLIVPLLFVILAATESLAALARARRGLLPAVALTVVALSIGLFLNLDFKQHWLTTESDLAFREPDLQPVNAAISAVGGRTISYAYLRDGSQFFNSQYGVPNPTLWFFWDPSSRYFTDGLGASGLFGRSDVRTVTASPNWTLDSGMLPQASKIDSSFPGYPIFSTEQGVLVKRIPSRPMLSVARASCVMGGPGLLDWAESIPELKGSTFVREPTSCRGRTYFDYDSRDDLISGSRVLGMWTARTLVPGASPLKDADYPFIVGRSFINDDWYRNSVDGDNSGSISGAQNILAPVSFLLSVRPVTTAKKMLILVRLASRVYTTLRVQYGNRLTASIAISPTRGMRWYTLPLQNAGQIGALSFTFDTFTTRDSAPVNDWQGIAFDRILALRDVVPMPEPSVKTDAVLFSVRRLAADFAMGVQSQNSGSPSDTSGSARLYARSHVFSEEVDGVKSEAAAGGRGTLKYRWNGVAGDYVVSAQATLVGSGSQVAIISGAHSAAAGPTLRARTLANVNLPLHLLRNSAFQIVLSDDESLPGGTAALRSLRIVRRQYAVPAQWLSRGSERFTVDLAEASSALGVGGSQRGIELADGGIRGQRDSSSAYRFVAKGRGNAANLRVGASGEGSAVLRLSCGARVVTRIIESGETDVSIAGEPIESCGVEIRWIGRELTVNLLELDVLEERLARVNGRIWLPRGSYSARLYQPAIQERRASLLVDGQANTGRIVVAHSGFHRISLDNVSSDDRVLAFLPDDVPKYSVPPAVRTSTLGWTVTVNRRSTLEVAWYPDGYWRLRNDSHGAFAAQPERCDLINTCFLDVRPGRYYLYHVWPTPFRIGVLISALTVVFACSTLLLPIAFAWIVIKRRTRLLDDVAA